MNTNISVYIQNRSKQQKEELLDVLGLYEPAKEYIDKSQVKVIHDHMGRVYYADGVKKEIVDGEERFYKEGVKIYPDISDEEFDSLIKIHENEERLQRILSKQEAHPETTKADKKEYLITASNTSEKCFSVSVMRILAWVLWVGGLVVALTLSLKKVEVNAYTSRWTFNWQIFIFLFSLYFGAGTSFYCLSQLFGNVMKIANSVERFKVSGGRESR